MGEKKIIRTFSPYFKIIVGPEGHDPPTFRLSKSNISIFIVGSGRLELPTLNV